MSGYYDYTWLRRDVSMSMMSEWINPIEKIAFMRMVT